MVDDLAYRAVVPRPPDRVLGIHFSSQTRDRLIRRILTEPIPQGSGARLLVTANVDHISLLAHNARFRAAYDGAWVATADGMPVYLYARMRGADLPERITGADITPVLIEGLSPASRPFFVVSSDDTAIALRRRLTALGMTKEAIASFCPPFGFEKDATLSAELAHAIREHRSTHLFFGLGAPKSEIWMHEHRHALGDVYALAIGASLDFYVGLRPRAPVWMRRAGLEWAWRFATEPRRLFRRYFVDSRHALWVMAKEAISGATPFSEKPDTL